jgi:trans-aconitate methyltransferase
MPQIVKIGLRSVYSREHRRLFAAHFGKQTDTHQPTNATAMDRYPLVFEAVQRLVGARPDLRLLSFGCSTGEEVVTLQQYFPKASIVGAEISDQSREACVARGLDARVRFIRSEPSVIADCGPYDVVFAMAVLQYLPHLMVRAGVRDLRRLYPFHKFDTQLRLFDSWLKPGGLIALQHTQYRFCDSSIAFKYEACGYDETLGAGPRLYGAGGRLLENERYHDVIFRRTRE